MLSPRRVTLIFLLLLLGIYGFLYFPRRRAEIAKNQQLAVMLSAPKPQPLILDERTKIIRCILGVLPDHACTPGAVFENAGLGQICALGYSKTVRNVSQKLRKAVYAEYGASYPQPKGDFEVDHLIPLSLGGSNDIANLFLEAAKPVPGFREKDLVENYLHEEVCAGRANIIAAQEQIASDWLAVYNNLTPEKIERLRTEFRNWSQQ